MAGTLLSRTVGSLLGISNQVQTQVRGYYVDWRMLRDVKRRRMVRDLNANRQRYNAIHRSTILPAELREVAHADVAAMPRDSNYVRLRQRCVLTSRARGVIEKWKLSRIVWRHQADYNQLSGIKRACW